MNIRINHISKSYGQVKALCDVSLDLQNEGIFGLIGPDGAGKTTLFRIITSLIKSDEGSVTINGMDVHQDYKTIRKTIGYMPGRFSLYQDLTVRENLEFYATIFDSDIKKNFHLIKPIYSQLEPFKNRLAGKLSGGMKQKLALCCALIHKPEIILLDEPTTGVDAVSRKEFWEMLFSLKTSGVSIIVSTPYMDEATMCDTIALIQKGKIMTVDSPGNIVKAFPKQLYSINTTDKYHCYKSLKDYNNMASLNLFGQSLHYTDIDNNADMHSLQTYLHQKGHGNATIEPIEASIEDCFIQLMQNETNMFAKKNTSTNEN